MACSDCALSAARPLVLQYSTTRLVGRVAGQLEFEHAARHVYRAGQVALGVLVGFAYIDRQIGLLHGILRLRNVHFMDAGLGGGDEVEGGFHGLLRQG